MRYALIKTGENEYKCPYCNKTWPTPVTNRVVRERPLHPHANEKANKEIEKCPHLQNPLTGSTRRLTMDRADYPCRRRWMDAYLSYCDEKPKKVKPTNPVQPCPKGILIVSVGYLVRKGYESIHGAIVSIEGPEFRKGSTRPDGTIVFADLTLGSYRVTATMAGMSTETDSTSAVPYLTAIITLCLHKIGPKKFQIKILSGSTKTATVGILGIGGGIMDLIWIVEIKDTEENAEKKYLVVASGKYAEKGILPFGGEIILKGGEPRDFFVPRSTSVDSFSGPVKITLSAMKHPLKDPGFTLHFVNKQKWYDPTSPKFKYKVEGLKGGFSIQVPGEAIYIELFGKMKVG